MTIRDVARESGVSPATVSRVVNGRFAGDEAIADRVQSVAARLEYSPNHLARSLAMGASQTVAFMVPDLANPAFHAVLASLSRAAARDEYRVLVADSDERADDEPALALDSRNRCDALVLCAPRMPDDRLLEVLDHAGPAVLVNRASPRADVPSVWVDYASGMAELLRHLYGQGHRSFVQVSAPASWSARSRARAVAAFRRRYPDTSVTTVGSGTGSDDGYRLAEQVAASGASAVLAFNDLVALGLIQGLFELGVDVPGDVSVVGFDDIPFARYSAPSLTTCTVPMAAVGEGAWERLRAVLAGETPPADRSYPTSLVVRGSSGRRY